MSQALPVGLCMALLVNGQPLKPMKPAPVSSWARVDQPLTIPASQAPALGTGDFTLTMWLKADDMGDLPTGDLLSRYDPATRRGFHLTLKTSSGVTSSQANRRHLQFGIDNNHASPWTDCGCPGKALLAFALATFDGSLYAGTCEPGPGQSGRVYRHIGGTNWVDCGAPDGSNAVTALAEHRGKLYAGTGKYRLAGSSLPESPNQTPGGRIFRHEGGTTWTDCGRLPGTEAVGGLVTYQGRLHATSLYRPAGFFRLEQNGTWTSLPVPQGTDAAGKPSPSTRGCCSPAATMAAMSTAGMARPGPTWVASATTPRPTPLPATGAASMSAPGPAAASTGSMV